MPEDIGFSGMRNTKQTVVGGGKVRCVCVLGGATTAQPHGWSQNSGELSRKGSWSSDKCRIYQNAGLSMRTGGRLSSCPRCLSSWFAISTASGPAHVLWSGQLTLRSRVMSANPPPPKKPSALLSGKRCHVSWQLAASCYLPSISFICVNDRCCQKFKKKTQCIN